MAVVCCRPMASTRQTNGTADPTTRSSSVGIISIMGKLGPSLWVSLIWDYIEETSNPNTATTIDTAKYFLLAAAIFVIWNLLSFACGKAYPTHKLPEHQTYYHDLDESKWYHWTVSEVMQWLQAELIGSHSNALLANEDAADLSWMLSRLAWEGVHGATLEYLDRETLRQMDIPYGTACAILDRIQTRLIHRYPRNISTASAASCAPQQELPMLSSSQQGDEELATFLSEYDREYQLSPTERLKRLKQQRQQQTWSHQDPSLNEQEMNHVREQIVPQWKLPAPNDIARKEGNSYQVRDNQRATHENEVNDGGLSEDVRAPTDPDVKAQMLDESLLQAMPPNIRDFVQRKPHLWQQVTAMNENLQNDAHDGRLTNEIQKREEHHNTESRTEAATAEMESHQPQEILSSKPANSTSMPPDFHQSLPPHIREIAQRNPQLFRQLLTAKQKQESSSTVHGNSRIFTVPEETFEDEETDETKELLPKSGLRQRPGF